MNKIYGFFNSKISQGDAVGYAIAEDGTVLASHISSHEEWAKHDLGMDDCCTWKHDTYNEYYPDGWETEFVYISNIDDHEGLQEAIRLNKIKAEEVDESGSN